MPTDHHDRRPGDVGEQLGRELRARARQPPAARPRRRREHPRVHPLLIAVLIVLAFFGLVFLAALAATTIDPSTGGWTP